MEWKHLGWSSFFESQLAESDLHDLTPARITEEQKGFFRVRSVEGEFLAQTRRRMHYHAETRAALPAVGDWVLVKQRGSGRARIERVLERRTKLSRKIAGRQSGEQILAANVDLVFVVTSANRDFNPRRIERYLTVVWDSGARPVILINKADLCSDSFSYLQQTEPIALGTPVLLLSALEREGFDAVCSHLVPGETAAFVGSSGVGKSTIINALLGADSLSVQPIRSDDDRGRHTTTSRQMLFLPEGGIVIDTPGLRELQLLDNENGLARTFDDIDQLARQCKFRDCSHRGEPGCAVERAVSLGILGRERLEDHQKLLAELRYQQRRSDPEAARKEKQKWKQIHQAMRHNPKSQ